MNLFLSWDIHLHKDKMYYDMFQKVIKEKNKIVITILIFESFIEIQNFEIFLEIIYIYFKCDVA